MILFPLAFAGLVLIGRKRRAGADRWVQIFAGGAGNSPDYSGFRWMQQQRRVQLWGCLGAWVSGERAQPDSAHEYVFSEDEFFTLVAEENRVALRELMHSCVRGTTPEIDLTIRLRSRGCHPCGQGDSQIPAQIKVLRLIARACAPEPTAWLRGSASDVCGVLLDTTWQVQAESLLRERSALQALLSGSINCLLLQWNDQGLVLQANPCAERFFGAGSLTGRRIAELLTEEASAFMNDNFPLYIDDIASHPDNYSNVIQNIQTKNGMSRISWTSQVTGSGSARTVISMGLDVSATCREEEELRRSECEKEIILGSISEGVVYLSPELEIVWVNEGAERLCRVRRPQLIGQRCHAVYCGAPQECASCPVRIARRFGRQAQGVRRLPDGRLFAISAAPVMTSGRVTGVVKTLADITRQSEQEDARRNMQKMQTIGQLAGGIAHDFNNRLCGLLGFAGLLQDTHLDYTQREYVRTIIKGAEHCAEMTRKLLAFSRQGRFSSRPVDLNRLCCSTSDLVAAAEGGQIEIVRELNEPAVVEGDEPLLHNLLMTLVFNARDAMPTGGRICLRTGSVRFTSPLRVPGQNALPSGDYVRLEVSDTGCGISEEAMAHVFEPFFTTKGASEGSGMSLAAAYGTVRSHGGAIIPYSRPGAGTTFEIFLPVCQPEADLSVGDEQGMNPEAGGLPEGMGDLLGENVGGDPLKNVLIIGGDCYDRVALRDGLMRIGCLVRIADNGPDGLALVRKYRLDLVLLDLSVRIIGSVAVFRELREIAPQTGVILYGRAEQRTEASFLLARGAKDFLCKPLNISMIRDNVLPRLERAAEERSRA